MAQFGLKTDTPFGGSLNNGSIEITEAMGVTALSIENTHASENVTITCSGKLGETSSSAMTLGAGKSMSFVALDGCVLDGITITCTETGTANVIAQIG